MLFAFKMNEEKLSCFSLSGNTSCHCIFMTLQLLKHMWFIPTSSLCAEVNSCLAPDKLDWGTNGGGFS